MKTLRLRQPTVVGLENDEFGAILDDLARRIEAVRAMVGPIEEDPYETLRIVVAPCGAARAPAMVEANGDAIRFWCLPMRRGRGPYSACLGGRLPGRYIRVHHLPTGPDFGASSPMRPRTPPTPTTLPPAACRALMTEERPDAP